MGLALKERNEALVEGEKTRLGNERRDKRIDRCGEKERKRRIYGEHKKPTHLVSPRGGSGRALHATRAPTCLAKRSR